jgi:CARDB
MRWVNSAAIVGMFVLLAGTGGDKPLRAAAQQKGSRVDLVQVQLLVPKKVYIGKAFRVVDEVENQGESLAFPSITGFYVSQDDQWDEKDILVGGRRVPQLGKDQTHEQITPVTLKPEIVPGNCYFLALADAKHQLEERYRENNLRAVPILILPAEK